jgi:hypothetical protein
MPNLNLEEVCESGPILAVNAELGMMITGNGAYLNYWIERSNGWDNVDARAREKDLWETSAADLWDEGKEALELWVNGPDEE